MGVMTALEAAKRWPRREIQIFDAGPDPRLQRGFSHSLGATYSGLDARHISLTETGPWTSSDRVELIQRPSADGGWNCLAGTHLSKGEEAWLREFVATAKRPELHSLNHGAVVELNRRGLAAWRELATAQPELFSPTESSGCLPILCSSETELDSEQAFEHDLDPLRVSSVARWLPDSLAPLTDRLLDGTIHGSFTVDGAAYKVKTLCARVITLLEADGVRFNWNSPVDGTADGTLPLPEGDSVWAAGTSTGMSTYLAEHGVILQGVAGCWVELPNRNFDQPFKVLGPEPVNFINVTPVGHSLVLSGGYGWVGERSLEEVQSLVRPLADAFESSVRRFFCKGRGDSLAKYPTAVCLRPSLPSGVPVIRVLAERGKGRHVLCVGHAAGGFTQAPAVASRALDELA